jgi:hypothetical protein
VSKRSTIESLIIVKFAIQEDPRGPTVCKESEVRRTLGFHLLDHPECQREGAAFIHRWCPNIHGFHSSVSAYVKLRYHYAKCEPWIWVDPVAPYSQLLVVRNYPSGPSLTSNSIMQTTKTSKREILSTSPFLHHL